jgi:hypothetical protein
MAPKMEDFLSARMQDLLETRRGITVAKIWIHSSPLIMFSFLHLGSGIQWISIHTHKIGTHVKIC